MANKTKQHFAAIPARAFLDRALDSNRRRDLLGVIALHDHMSAVNGKGQGCWATSRRLATMIGSSEGRARTEISYLIKHRYLTVEPNPEDSRKRVLRVVYDPERDLAAAKATLDDAQESDSVRSRTTTPGGVGTAPGCDSIDPRNPTPGWSINHCNRTPIQPLENIGSYGAKKEQIARSAPPADFSPPSEQAHPP
jgi:hypothetical protein